MDFASMLAWVQENIEGILAAVLAAHALAVAVVNLTPTPKDNEIVGKVYKVIEFVAGIFTRKAKELPGESKWADEDTKAGA
jgi:hypothetical protein